ncbi:sigma-70 family RNA polymerase sigma factor [Plesiocystis pacifica]|uniref:RNA polymerase sigma factor n=1 Tax=Plesiocystis pacifica TaxID=191768 RepID=UPI000A307FF7
MDDRCSPFEAFLRADDVGIASFVAEHHGWAVKYALRRGRVASDVAEDIVNSIWVKLIERPPEGLEGYPPRALLALWLRWRCTDWHRKARSQPITMGTMPEFASPEDISALARHGRILDEVRGAVLRLQTLQREVLRLACEEGLNSTQIGSRLSVSPSTVRGILRRGRIALRLELGLS